MKHIGVWLFYVCLIAAACIYAYAFVQDVRGKWCPNGGHLVIVAAGKTPIYGCSK